MLASIPFHQSLPAKPQSKDNSISEAGNGEEFSEHLDAKPVVGPERELSESTELTLPELQLTSQLTSQDGALVLNGEISTDVEMTFDLEVDLKPEQQLPEIVNSHKILNELRFSNFVNRQEIELIQPTNNEEMLLPTSEVTAEPLAVKIAPSVANQGFDGGEKIVPNAPIQIVAVGNGLVREPKPFKEKNDKSSPTVSVNVQTPIAVKPATNGQNAPVQLDASVQSKIDLPQEQNPSSNADLEKTVRSLDLKVNSAPVSVDPSSSKPTADGNIPALSQPSQTLVRAIQENSNWTKVLNTSSVQLDTTPKLDGTVLQKLDIHLNLSTIGKLDVKLRLQQGELQIQIRTDSEQAFKALSADQDALANTIKGLGYKVDNIAISGPRADSGFQMNSNSQAQSQHHSAEQQAQNENGGQRTDREFMPMKDAENDTPLASLVDEDITSDVDVI